MSVQSCTDTMPGPNFQSKAIPSPIHQRYSNPRPIYESITIPPILYFIKLITKTPTQSTIKSIANHPIQSNARPIWQSHNQMPIGDQVDVTELTTVEAVLIQLSTIHYPPSSSHPIHPSIAYLDWHQLTLNRYALAPVRPTLNSCHYKLYQHSISLNISIYLLKTGLTSIDMHRHKSRQSFTYRRPLP
jgi:hypothetical protein